MTVTLRPARPTDAGTTGEILAQFQNETPWMPKLYSGAETIALCAEMIERSRVVVAIADEHLVGFLTRDDEEVRALYIFRQARCQWVGQQLLNDAKSGRDRLWLKVFQANARAQKFYQREGFDEVGRGDGTGNDENLPDISLVWQREVSG